MKASEALKPLKDSTAVWSPKQESHSHPHPIPLSHPVRVESKTAHLYEGNQVSEVHMKDKGMLYLISAIRPFSSLSGPLHVLFSLLGPHRLPCPPAPTLRGTMKDEEEGLGQSWDTDFPAHSLAYGSGLAGLVPGRQPLVTGSLPFPLSLAFSLRGVNSFLLFPALGHCTISWFSWTLPSPSYQVIIPLLQIPN